MKKYIQFLLPAILLAFAWSQLNGQCEPDPACIDDGDPGEICPYRLPDGMVDAAYEAIITVIAPGEYELDSATSIEIAYLTLDSISNLPEGLTYVTGSDRFWADSASCVAIIGIPQEEGEFPLHISVTPWIYFESWILPYESQVDDSSVVLTILPAADLRQMQAEEFRIVSPYPNPFPETIQVGFYTPVAGSIEMEVFNLLGKSIYREGYIADPGEGFFRFDGSSLQPGPYFYRISNSSATFTGKFVKIRK